MHECCMQAHVHEEISPGGRFERPVRGKNLFEQKIYKEHYCCAAQAASRGGNSRP